MVDITRPDMAAASFVQSQKAAEQIGWDSVQQVLDRSQTIAAALMDFGHETLGFVGNRIDQGSEALGSVAKCRSLPEMLELEAQWWRRAMDDYTSQVNRLLAFNASLLGCIAEAPARGDRKPMTQAVSEPVHPHRHAA